MKGQTSLAVELVSAVALLIALAPGLTGVVAHEWLGLAALAMLLVHCAVRLDRRRRSRAGAGGLALDAALLVVLAVVGVSGLGVSGSVLPSLGWYVDGYHFWNPLHAVSAKVLLALALVHVALHADRVVAEFRKRSASYGKREKRA